MYAWRMWLVLVHTHARKCASMLCVLMPCVRASTRMANISA